MAKPSITIGVVMCPKHGCGTSKGAPHMLLLTGIDIDACYIDDGDVNFYYSCPYGGGDFMAWCGRGGGDIGGLKTTAQLAEIKKGGKNNG